MAATDNDPGVKLPGMRGAAALSEEVVEEIKKLIIAGNGRERRAQAEARRKSEMGFAEGGLEGDGEGHTYGMNVSSTEELTPVLAGKKQAP